LSLATDGPDDYLDVLILIPLALTLAAVVALHTIQGERTGWLGRAGFLLALVAIPAVMLGTLFHVVGLNELEWVGFPLGAIGFLAFLVLLGMATARAGVFPRWWGVVLALSQPLTILVALALSPISPVTDYGNYTGAIVHGAVWLAFAYLVRVQEALTAL
jgi:hypothetical protein